jgi:hypothetical protein
MELGVRVRSIDLESLSFIRVGHCDGYMYMGIEKKKGIV